MRTLGFLLLLPLLLISAPAQADDADGVLGQWLTADGKARVEVVKDGDSYDGKIVWLKEPVYPADDKKGMGGETKIDRENPDKTLQNRPILGLPLIQGFKYDGGNVWVDGSIYDPESGKTYSCKMTLMMDGRLKVRGYVGISLFGRTEIWTRPPADSPAPTAATKS
ncbi:MAG: DUF2147 domain-containing protein [Bacillota bacterium]